MLRIVIIINKIYISGYYYCVFSCGRAFKAERKKGYFFYFIFKENKEGPLARKRR